MMTMNQWKMMMTTEDQGLVPEINNPRNKWTQLVANKKKLDSKEIRKSKSKKNLCNSKKNNETLDLPNAKKSKELTFLTKFKRERSKPKQEKHLRNWEGFQK